MSNGFYLMHRGWHENAVFRNEAYSRRDAFVWLIEQAAYTPRQVHAPRGIITIGRGQLCHSTRFMAKAWKWDEAKVRRFVSALLAAKTIDASTDAGQYVITICNYDKYQSAQAFTDAANDAASPQHRRGDDAKKKEGKEGKETGSKEPLANPFLGDAWDGWIEMRRKANKQPTDRAVAQAVAKLEKLKADGHDPGEVLDQSTMNNWTGLFPVRKDERNGRPAEKSASGLGRTIDAALDFAREIDARNGA